MRVIRNNGAFFIDNGRGRIFNINYPEGASLRLEDKKGVDRQINAIKVKEARNRLNESIVFGQIKGSVSPRKENNYTVTTVDLPPVKAPASRMAGEEVNIDDLLNSLKEDVARESRAADLESDAIQYISDRAIDFSQMGFDTSQSLKTGKLGKIEGALMQLGELKGGVPMPITRNGDGTQERVFVKYGKNPVTGQEKQIVPYLDPNDETQAVKLTYGQAVPDRNVQADELVSEAALKMLGYKVDMPQNQYVADFQTVDKDGYAVAIDGMQIEQNQPIDMQAASFVGMRNASGDALSKYELQQYLDRKRGSGENIVSIIDGIADSGNAIGSRHIVRGAGKAMRGDHTSGRVSEEQMYDALIMPEYSRSRRYPIDDSERPANMVIAPQGIMMADMPGVFNVLNQGGGGKPRAVSNRNNRIGAHKINVPMNRNTKDNGQKVFIDLIENNPQLAQLLDEGTMKRMSIN